MRIQTHAFIDLHVHLREPGQVHKGDIAHETAAAQAGGFGLVVAMANTTPAIDRPARWEEQRRRLAECAAPGVQVVQCACMTVERAGKEPVDAAALAAAGVIALSDDGSTTGDAGVMRECAARAREAGLLMIDHCEDAESTRRGELALVERDIVAAMETGARFHLQHLSTAEAVEMVRQARRDGIPVSGEATPHHLALDETAVARWGTNAKMSPPLRLPSDRLALLRGVADGTLAVVATDHAPHTAEEKGLEWSKAPNGIIGLECAFAVACTALVHGGLMTLEELVERFTTGPAQVLGVAVPQRTIEVEYDPEHPVRISTDGWRSKARNCPWEGFLGYGRVFTG